MLEMDKPPYSNRGAENTEKSLESLINKGISSVIDWLGFTVKNTEKLSYFLEIMNLKYDDFTEMPKGMLGYKKQNRFSHIGLLEEGREDMGFHFELSGQGVREFEELIGRSWEEWFILALKAGANFTRIDLALDDIKKESRYGYFTVKKILKCVRNSECVSLCTVGQERTEYDLLTGKTVSSTVYIGSEKSRIRFRIYDKAAQQGYMDGHWVRTEIQARNERAQVIAEQLSLGLNVGSLASGIINNYMSFKELDNNDSNRSRWIPYDWWLKFLNDVDKIKLTMRKPDNTIIDLENWLFKQVSSTMALMTRYYGETESKVLFSELVRTGNQKFSKKHEMILQRAQIMNKARAKKKDFSSLKEKSFK